MRLIVNADDFGLAHSVNNAILQVWKTGNLSSTTLMVNMPGTAHAIELAKSNPGLKAGLHFCITEGNALSGINSLTGSSGKFLTRPELLKKLFYRKIKQEDVAGEFLLQLARFRSSGLHLSHVDSHQHIHMHPFIFNAILPVINDQKIPARLVYPALHFSLLLSRPAKFIKQYLLNKASRRFSKLISSSHNTGFISIHDLPNPRSVSAEAYNRLMASTPNHSGVVELMIHPYMESDDVKEIYKNNPGKNSFLEKCFAEFRVLSSEPIFIRQGITLTSYDSI